MSNCFAIRSTRGLRPRGFEYLYKDEMLVVTLIGTRQVGTPRLRHGDGQLIR
jgi:hypothetical protein